MKKLLFILLFIHNFCFINASEISRSPTIDSAPSVLPSILPRSDDSSSTDSSGASCGENPCPEPRARAISAITRQCGDKLPIIQINITGNSQKSILSPRLETVPDSHQEISEPESIVSTKSKLISHNSCVLWCFGTIVVLQLAILGFFIYPYLQEGAIKDAAIVAERFLLDSEDSIDRTATVAAMIKKIGLLVIPMLYQIKMCFGYFGY